MTAEIVEHGGWVAAAILGAAGLVREGLRLWKHRANNAAQVAVSAREHDAAVAPVLMQRIEAQDERIESLSQALSESEARCASKMDAALADADRKCDERSAARVAAATAPLHEAIATLAGTLRRSMSADDTGVHEVERIARLSITSREIPAATSANDEES